MLFKKPKPEGRVVSICIPTRFDSRYVIELCLKSIWKYTEYPDYQIIVCDSGVDETTRLYLEDLQRQGKIRLIKATNPLKPKDDLADAVDTEYYLIIHDDVRILKKGWIERRLELMLQDGRNAIVGTATKNYEKNQHRFFPLGLLVKTSVARKLGLRWGKDEVKGYDTGAYAYQVFFAQKEYKFVPYKFTRDIFHFSKMAWPKRKDKNDPEIEKILSEREQKIAEIRKILDSNQF